MSNNDDKIGLDIFHKAKPHTEKITDESLDLDVEEPKRSKHHVKNRLKFEENRESLGEIVIEGMKTTGGTDVDWLIEHRGGFVIIEVKTFSDDRIRLPLAQMIAYSALHKQLNKDTGICYFYIIGVNSDFPKTSKSIWVFEMRQWNMDGIVDRKNAIVDIDFGGDITKGYLIERGFMNLIQLKDLQKKIEEHWIEFEKGKSRSN